MPALWKKGRGKFGVMQPLLGSWVASADSEMGPVRCTRVFESVLNGAYIQLKARWEFGAISPKAIEKCPDPSKYAGHPYEEFEHHYRSA